MINGSIRINTFSSIGFAINAYKNGEKMSVPVSSANYIYSHFKHVSGVRAPDGVRGVTINRIKILDSLIEHLNQSKKQEDPVNSPVSDEYLDALIKQYEDRIRQTMLTSATVPYSKPSMAPVGKIIDQEA
jgi:hypothetical protein